MAYGEGVNASPLLLDDRESGIFRINRRAFVDEEILRLERERIFDRCWLFAGHQSEFPNPGDFVTRSVAGRPLILCTGDDGKVRVMLNTCRHRGNLVCREAKGKGAEVFRCFYHGWIFNTRGELKGIPGEEAYSDAFDREALGLEPVPRVHNHRGVIFISFDPNVEEFYSYMGAAINAIDNTLNLGDMEFVNGYYKYSMRANWKLLVENSMDAYHGPFTHERFFSHFMQDMKLPSMVDMPPPKNNKEPFGGSMPPGNGHVGGYPTQDGMRADIPYLEKFAPQGVAEARARIAAEHGADKVKMIEGGCGNYLIFPNLILVDGWRVFRTFYPSRPGYMEINGWACLPKEDSPEMRKARLDWYIGFQGPGGFATPDDVEGLEGCQMGFETHREVEWSDLSRCMKNKNGPMGEEHLRGFWREWLARITTGGHADNHAD
ncbi:MAG: Rieske 2Fe-2S domain-containing protein [Hyphomonadaceae bacterium]